MASGTLARRTEKLERYPLLGVFAPPPIAVDCPEFSGSLGVLLQLVADHRIDLMRVPLLPICETYFEYLLRANLDNLDEAAAALLALAFLLERKSWQLLPTPEVEPELELEGTLIDPSIAYFLPAIEAMNVWREERERLYFRSADAGPNPYEVPYELEEVTSADLARALERLLSRAQPSLPELTRRHRSLEEQMRATLRALSSSWQNMESLMPGGYTREDAVFWFLALLELIRLGQTSVRLKGDAVEFRLRAA